MTRAARPWWMLAAVLLVIFQAASVGVSDDEAYYWVLGQHPGWGFAYHPPAVAWLVAIFEWLFGFLRAISPVLPMRLGAIACWWGCMVLARRWMGPKAFAGMGGALLLGFPAFTGLAWMVVPDWTFLLGHLLALLGSWEWISRRKPAGLVAVSVGVALALTSKFTGLVTGLALAGVAWQLRRKPREMAALLGAAALGGCVGVLPTLIWNSQHEWYSLRYQFVERHQGGGISLPRWGRFWASQILIVGVGLLAAAPRLLRSQPRDAASRFIRIWVVAGALFLIQPLFSDFKVHWAVVIWLPLMLEFGRRAEERGLRPFARLQIVCGAVVIAAVLITSQLPIVAWVSGDLRKDVAADLRGWAGWAREFRNEDGLPVVGARYQTASQAAFALQGRAPVALWPRARHEADEWPEVDTARGFYFVTNSRYDQAPSYESMTCSPLPRYEERWGGRLAQWIEVWRCVPVPRHSGSGR